MAESNITSTALATAVPAKPTLTISIDDFDAVTLRLEQIGAIIKTFGIQLQETEEVPVSIEILAVSLLGFATFLTDTRRRLCDSVQCGGVEHECGTQGSCCHAGIGQSGHNQSANL
jgi:hypothetical protein